MSWSELDLTEEKVREQVEALKQSEEAAFELAKKFYRVFNSDDGKVVFQHLYQRFVTDNHTPFSSENINYEAAYHNGEAGLIKYMANQISKATQQ